VTCRRLRARGRVATLGDGRRRAHRGAATGQNLMTDNTRAVCHALDAPRGGRGDYCFRPQGLRPQRAHAERNVFNSRRRVEAGYRPRSCLVEICDGSLRSVGLSGFSARLSWGFWVWRGCVGWLQPSGHAEHFGCHLGDGTIMVVDYAVVNAGLLELVDQRWWCRGTTGDPGRPLGIGCELAERSAALGAGRP
jgi:hypothetical protein